MGKRMHSAIVSALTALLLLAAIPLGGCSDKKKEHKKEQQAAAIASLGVGSWRPTSTGGNCPSPRVANTLLWTGSEMVVWGGCIDDYTVTNTGAIYDPQTDTWRPTSTQSGCPTGRAGHTAIWTGSKIIVWGGPDYKPPPTGWSPLNTGAIYNPEDDTWQPTSTGANCPAPTMAHTAVWTGSKMIIWGGYVNSSATNTGSIYDPITDSWILTSTGVGCPPPQYNHFAFWTGDKMFIFGGGNGSAYNLPTGGLYDPQSDSWEEGCASPASEFYTAVWTGDSVIWWGGASIGLALDYGSIYNLDNDTWTPISIGYYCPSVRLGHTAVWTGSRMIIWGGSGGLNTGGIYNPESDSWVPTYYGPSTPLARYAHGAIWTGDSMIIWGGMHYDGVDNILINTGGVFTP